jgi:cellobiose phosphorylase
MIAGLFLHACSELAALHRHLGRAAEAARLEEHRGEMLAAVEEHAWDGDWYLRAFDAAGRAVGSRSSDEGQIFLESQAWCALGGAGRADGRARRALESVHERLFSEHGLVLVQPAFTRYRPELGEITSYPPGVKENAGVFCHTNPWIQLAWCLLGEGDRAFESWLAVCPSAQEERIERYRSEPYVYAQMIAGRDAPTCGEAKNSWLTGAAAWNLVAVTQWILGIRPTFEGLRIAPVIPSDWPGFRAVRVFRGATFDISVERAGPGNNVTLVVDGRPIDGDVAPLAPAGSRVQVRVTVG